MSTNAYAGFGPIAKIFQSYHKNPSADYKYLILLESDTSGLHVWTINANLRSRPT